MPVTSFGRSVYLGILSWPAETVRLVIHGGAAVAVEAHRAILVVSVKWALRLVHGQGIVIYAQTVAVRVWIGDQACLQHFVRRKTHARRDVPRFERGLFDFREIILGIAVEFEFADFMQRIVFVRPHLGQIERIDGGTSPLPSPA